LQLLEPIRRASHCHGAIGPFGRWGRKVIRPRGRGRGGTDCQTCSRCILRAAVGPPRPPTRQGRLRRAGGGRRADAEDPQPARRPSAEEAGYDGNKLAVELLHQRLSASRARRGGSRPSSTHACTPRQVDLRTAASRQQFAKAVAEHYADVEAADVERNWPGSRPVRRRPPAARPRRPIRCPIRPGRRVHHRRRGELPGYGSADAGNERCSVRWTPYCRVASGRNSSTSWREDRHGQVYVGAECRPDDGDEGNTVLYSSSRSPSRGHLAPSRGGVTGPLTCSWTVRARHRRCVTSWWTHGASSGRYRSDSVTPRRIDAIERIAADHVADGGKLIIIDQMSMIEVPRLVQPASRRPRSSATAFVYWPVPAVPIVLVAKSTARRPKARST